MNQYFDVIKDRRSTNSLKWDIPEGELPMWVADMDFETAPAITKALEERAKQGVFGYEIVPEEWAAAIQGWWKKRHGFTLEQKWLLFCTGVVPAITSIVKRLTNVGDYVVTQTPVYDIFFHSIENTGRHVLENPLRQGDGAYTIDFENLEKALANPLTKLMILCNPHNPVGRLWTREELQRIGSMCAEYGVIVVADEIHCELTRPGREYVPFASIDEKCRDHSVSCWSASKAFNIAGLQSACVCVPNERIRQVVNRGLNADEVAEPNAFAVAGTIAAYTQSEEWLDALREYLFANVDYVQEELQRELPRMKMTECEATYLLWLDCHALTDDTKALWRYLRERAKVFLSYGGAYRGDGAAFLRMNAACPRAQVEEGVRRLVLGVREWEKENAQCGKERI